MALVLAMGSFDVAAQRSPGDGPGSPSPLRHLQQGGSEASEIAACERLAGRVFVAHALGTECIAYHITEAPAAAAGPPASPAPAVFYFHGDFTAREVEPPNFAANHLARLRVALEAVAKRERVRFIHVSRPGVLGSSGNHANRWTAREMQSMSAAVDAIKARHGLGDIAVAGQSGGATVAAALLTLGRRDIVCAALGSGGLLLTETVTNLRATTGVAPLEPSVLKRLYYDPADHIAGMAQQPARRIFVLGDPDDVRTPFKLQRMFVERAKAHGHHAIAIEVKAEGERLHGVAHLALPVAASCMRGEPDREIIAAATKTPVRPVPPELGPRAGGTKGAVRETLREPR